WRVGHEAVMIGEDGPGLEAPAEVARDSEQTAMQDAQAGRAPEMVRFEIGAGGEEVSAARAELVSGRVRPGGAVWAHGGSVEKEGLEEKPKMAKLLECASLLALFVRLARQSQSGRGLPHSKTW